jgi:hypothetical protein
MQKIKSFLILVALAFNSFAQLQVNNIVPDSRVVFNTLTNGNSNPTKHGFLPQLKGSAAFDLEGGYQPSHFVNVLSYGADTNGVDDSKTAFDAAIAATPIGGELYIPRGSFSVSTLTFTKPIRLVIHGEIICRSITTNWIQITGTNVFLDGQGLGIINGADKAHEGVRWGSYSKHCRIEGLTFKKMRITDLNDPSNTASTGSATAVAVRGSTGNKFHVITRNRFEDISYDGTKVYLGGVGRTARGVLYAPSGTAVTWEDAVSDIEVSHNVFTNTASADWGKVDADAAVFQNVSGAVTNCNIKFTYNYIFGWGWRGLKGQVPGGICAWNEVTSFTTGIPGVGVAMRSPFEVFYSGWDISHNTVHPSGSFERGIAAISFTANGQIDGVRIHKNKVYIPAAYATATTGIAVTSVLNPIVTGNFVQAARDGIRIQGDSRNAVLTGNLVDSNTQAGVLTIAENDAAETAFFGLSPSNVVVMATSVRTGNRGLWFSTGTRKVKYQDPIGNTTLPVVVAADVTGTRVLEYDLQDVPANGEVATYNSATGLVNWSAGGSGSSGGTLTALGDAATLTGLDLSLSDNFIVELGGNRTIPVPSNIPTGGKFFYVTFVHDATRTISHTATNFVFSDQITGVTLSTALPTLPGGGTAGKVGDKVRYEACYTNSVIRVVGFQSGYAY